MIHVVLSNWGKVEPGGQSGEQCGVHRDIACLLRMETPVVYERQLS